MPNTSPRNASPRTQRKRPGDLTGVNSQKLAAKRDAEKAEEEKMAAQAVADEKEARKGRTVDYSTGPTVAEPVNEIDVDDTPGEPEAAKEELDPAVAAALELLKSKGFNLAQVPTAGTGTTHIDVADEVEVRAKKEYIRVNFPIENMTYGREVIDDGGFDPAKGEYTRPVRLGNLRVLNFDEGTKYLVDADVADHLRSLGYVYEF